MHFLKTCKNNHTLSAVDLIYSIGAVCLSIAHKQRMQRTVASTVLCWPRCEDMQQFFQCTANSASKMLT